MKKCNWKIQLQQTSSLQQSPLLVYLVHLVHLYSSFILERRHLKKIILHLLLNIVNISRIWIYLSITPVLQACLSRNVSKMVIFKLSQISTCLQSHLVKLLIMSSRLMLFVTPSLGFIFTMALQQDHQDLKRSLLKCMTTSWKKFRISRM